MTIIYLDGQPVVVSKKSLKLTVENPFFTKTSSYTYDVDFPLDIPDNRKIFGRIQRLDVAKTHGHSKQDWSLMPKRTYPGRRISHPSQILL